MNKVRQVLLDLSQQNKTALMPFIAAGDPNLQCTTDLIVGLNRAGCDLLELGFPYSDPIADGPVIQEAYGRALQNDVRVDEIFELMANLKSKVNMPIVAMVSYSVVFRIGVSHFVHRAVDCGFSGAIVPDLPVEEADELLQICRQYDFAFCPLITPMTEPDRAVKIARAATGFIYFVSVVGITGERARFAANLEQKLTSLRSICDDTPICIGFGISQPEHIAELAPLADGLIVGSAFVRRIQETAAQGNQAVTEEVVKFARSLLELL